MECHITSQPISMRLWMHFLNGYYRYESWEGAHGMTVTVHTRRGSWTFWEEVTATFSASFELLSALLVSGFFILFTFYFNNGKDIYNAIWNFNAFWCRQWFNICFWVQSLISVYLWLWCFLDDAIWGNICYSGGFCAARVCSLSVSSLVL